MNRICFLWIVLLCLLPCSAQAGLSEDVTEGYSLLDQWRVEEADAYTEQLLKKYPRSGDVHFLQSRIRFFQGRYQEGEDLLKDVDDTQPLVRDLKSLLSRTHKITSQFVARETKHFIIRFPDGPDEVLFDYASKVLEASYQKLGEIIGYFPPEKILVEIYPDRVPFSEVSPLTLKEIVTSGTVALCKYRRIMMISPGSMVRGYNWMDTLSHEYVHYLLSRASNNNVPLWLHEGIAKYLEVRWRNGQPMSPVMETVLASGLKNDYLIALEDMMPSLAKLKSAEDVQLAYAEVATMVQHLVAKKGEAALKGLVKDLAKEMPFDKALEKQSGMTLTQFQADWKLGMKQRKLRTIPGLTVQKFQFKKRRDSQTGISPPINEEEVKNGLAEAVGGKRSRDLILLGDLLKKRNFVKAAILEYEKAIDASQSLSPILYNKLAGTYMDEKNYERALELLNQIKEYYPQFPTTLANLGELNFRTGNMDEAAKFYEEAVEINPFHPAAHTRLIQIFDSMGNQEKRDRQQRLYQFIK